jgi:hypothetical protein
MKLLKILPLFLLMITAALLSIACSKNISQTDPDLLDYGDSNTGIENPSNRKVFGIYDVVIDPIGTTFSVTPIDRSSQYHFPLTQLYPNVLTITGYGFSPNFWADIKITHPLPNSGIDGFDPRVIAILPAIPGVSMYYPSLDVLANNSVVLNHDGYTKLFDNAGGAIPGNTNPFLAYFKHVEYRRWYSSGSGLTSDTRRWDMDINGFGGPMQFKLVVDVSTNYPDPPEPVIDNALESVQIESVIGDGLNDSGGTATIDVSILDWQGESTIESVFVEAPDLFDGLKKLAYSHQGTEPNTYTFTGTIENLKHASRGNYNVAVTAEDTETSNAIMIECSASVESYFNVEDVTPSWLNYGFSEVNIVDSMMYVAGELHGLHIFYLDNDDPANPTWVNTVATSGSPEKIFTLDGYVYSLVSMSEIQIIDVAPPESAHPVSSIELDGFASEVDFYASGSYLYVVDGSDIRIYDISTPESPEMLKELDSGELCYSISIKEGMAYIGRYEDLYIVDIEPPETANVIKTVDIADGFNWAICIKDHFCYLGGNFNFSIIDIEQPGSANVIKTVTLPQMAYSICVDNGYAFVADNLNGMQVIDVDPPETSHIVNTYDTQGFAWFVTISGNHVFLSDILEGLFILDIESPETPELVNYIPSGTSSRRVHVEGDYAFVSGSLERMKIFDISSPESSSLAGFTRDLMYSTDVYVIDKTAYVLGNGDLYIMDVNDPESPDILKIVDISSYLACLHVSDGFACVVDHVNGLYIIDIDPVEQASIIKTISGVDFLYVFVSDGYAYVLKENRGLYIYDIDPPASASLVKEIQTYTPSAIYVKDNLAYLANKARGVDIIDISSPSDAHIVNTISTPGEATGIFIDRGYAYIADFSAGVQVLDVDPPELSDLILTIDTKGHASDVFVSGNYMYVADDYGGLRIIKLR